MLEKNLPVKDAEVESEYADWNPLRLLDPLKEFRRLPFAGLIGDVQAMPTPWMPRADIRETDKEYVLDVYVPGVRKEDVKVEVKDEVLYITGEKKSEKEEKGKNWLRRESSHGEFMRSFALPEGMHPEDVKASYKDGVLTLTMHKPAQIKKRGVGIRVE